MPATVEPEAASTVPPRASLFRKFLFLSIGLVAAALLVNSVIEFGFAWRDNQAQFARLQVEKAAAAAARIEQFIGEIQRQLAWTTYAEWADSPVEQRRFDYELLLRQVPAITEVTQINALGREQLKVSRLGMNVVGSGIDDSRAPMFVEAQAKRQWFSPVHFRKESEPYLTLAVAGAGRQPNVTVAEVNLKLIWDVITAIQIGRTGYAYVVDREGRLIAYPDMSLVLRRTSVAALPQVATALRTLDSRTPSPAIVVPALDGRLVLSAHVPLPALGWLVFVELPMTEALAPLIAAALRTLAVLVAGIAIAALAAWVMVRRLTGPLHQLQAGAALIGAGDLNARISVATGDELEALAGQFNTMAGQLHRSYSQLERKVAERTRDLSRSVTEMHALIEVGQAVNSTLDLGTVLRTVVSRAVPLAGADAGAIYRYDAADSTFLLAESAGLDAALVSRLRALRIASAETAMGTAAATGRPVQLPDLPTHDNFPLRDALIGAGFHAALVVPLTGQQGAIGALSLVRRQAGPFVAAVEELMTAFANQSALAMENAKLFQELADKSRQLELASAHKSQFLANMSHELRTPLNAILGYTELLVDGIYGDLAEKPLGVLQRVQDNGRNLLALINDVLDLSKIEAGQLTLTIEEYSPAELARTVISAMEPLARAKGLALSAQVVGAVATARGDARRLGQVVTNLVGNAIKFTDRGSVTITTAAAEGRIRIMVSDTGPGIPPGDQAAIFEKFRQVDNTNTRTKGGTGLGLAISRTIVESHGGTLTLASSLGDGASFTIDIPVNAEARA